MRNKLPGAQMTSIVIWAQYGSFVATCSVVRGGSGCGCGSGGGDGVAEGGGGSEVRRRVSGGVEHGCHCHWMMLNVDVV